MGSRSAKHQRKNCVRRTVTGCHRNACRMCRCECGKPVVSRKTVWMDCILNGMPKIHTALEKLAKRAREREHGMTHYFTILRKQIDANTEAGVWHPISLHDCRVAPLAHVRSTSIKERQRKHLASCAARLGSSKITQELTSSCRSNPVCVAPKSAVSAPKPASKQRLWLRCEERSTLVSIVFTASWAPPTDGGGPSPQLQASFRLGPPLCRSLVSKTPAGRVNQRVHDAGRRAWTAQGRERSRAE